MLIVSVLVNSTNGALPIFIYISAPSRSSSTISLLIVTTSAMTSAFSLTSTCLFPFPVCCFSLPFFIPIPRSPYLYLPLLHSSSLFHLSSYPQTNLPSPLFPLGCKPSSSTLAPPSPPHPPPIWTAYPSPKSNPSGTASCTWPSLCNFLNQKPFAAMEDEGRVRLIAGHLFFGSRTWIAN